MNQLQSATRSGPKSKLWYIGLEVGLTAAAVHRAAASFIILTAVQVP